MALPAVIALVGNLAGSSAVQSAALKIAGNVYERIMSPKPEAGSRKVSIETLADRLDDMPTRDELIASFAALQAELDRRHQRSTVLVAFVLVLQLVLIGILLLR